MPVEADETREAIVNGNQREALGGSEQANKIEESISHRACFIIPPFQIPLSLFLSLTHEVFYSRSQFKPKHPLNQVFV